jgi:hypothetical protein
MLKRKSTKVNIYRSYFIAYDDANSENDNLDRPVLFSQEKNISVEHPMSPIPKNIEMSPQLKTERKSDMLQLYRFSNQMKANPSKPNTKRMISVKSQPKLVQRAHRG